MVETIVILDSIRLIVGVVILSYASYTDIKTRRASNMNWLIMGLIGAILLIIQYFTVGFDNIGYLIFIPVFIGLIYAFFQLRLIYGGADAKAFMAIAILVPIKPEIFQFSLMQNPHVVFPGSLIIFLNSIILFLAIPISLCIYNLAKRNIKFPHIFLGYKMSVEKAKEKFVWPLEKIVNGKTKIVAMPKDFDIDEELKSYEKLGIKTIWVTPKVPFMIPMLAGFIVSFIVGEILFSLINSII